MKTIVLAVISVPLTCSTLSSAQDIDDTEEWICEQIEFKSVAVSSKNGDITTDASRRIISPSPFRLRRTAGSVNEWTYIYNGEAKLSCSEKDAVYRRLDCETYEGRLLIDLPSGYGVSFDRVFTDRSLDMGLISLKCQAN